MLQDRGGELRGYLRGQESMFISPSGDEGWETREHHFTVWGDNKEEGEDWEEETDPDDWDGET